MKEEQEGSLLVGTMANEMIGKRRLTIEQVRSLERNFEVENKLEPERKMQLAKELGLRPRQVAVWFQNRRARWKTKQLERDYETLAADYERLKADYQKILGEKMQLKADVQRLGAAVVIDDGDDDKKLENCENSHNARSLAPRTVDDVTQLAQQQHCKDDHGALSGSSSDVMDADSPRTTDHSSHCEDHLIDSSNHVFLAEDSAVLPTAKLEDRRLDTDGFHDEFGDQSSCDYLLLQLDEPQSELPWWDWP